MLRTFMKLSQYPTGKKLYILDLKKFVGINTNNSFISQTDLLRYHLEPASISPFKRRPSQFTVNPPVLWSRVSPSITFSTGQGLIYVALVTLQSRLCEAVLRLDGNPIKEVVTECQGRVAVPDCHWNQTRFSTELTCIKLLMYRLKIVCRKGTFPRLNLYDLDKINDAY
ncbi:hypothetical protein RRG08_023799 [Elysia crispata]|uniref:Uncharacterized protein n=1 Tax=Elysia crispata TaxID=231223 RepID=A0AAE1DN37_9GAST|nr:hypothetical protein RRG08_023799 [Elysia crispata]